MDEVTAILYNHTENKGKYFLKCLGGQYKIDTKCERQYKIKFKTKNNKTSSQKNSNKPI